MIPQNCNELEELIRILHQGDRSGAYSDMKDDEYLVKMMDYLSSEDREMIEQVIRWLEEDSNRNEVEYVNLKPNISIMIAHANCKLENQQQTLHHAKFATEQFRRYPNLWNQALAFWFLGIVYRNNGDFDETENAFKTAKELLENHAVDAHRNHKYKTRDICYEYMLRIEQAINDLPPRTNFSHSLRENKGTKSRSSWFADKFRRSSSSSPTGPAPTTMKKNAFTVNGGRLRQMKRGNETMHPNQEAQESSRTPSPGSGSSSFHIIIPLDIQALMNPQKTSHALDAGLYEQLIEYNLWKTDRISTNEGAQVKNPHRLANKPRFIIPPFPIYGRATAGPKGEITFEEPEDANGVTEDNQVEFLGIRYKVYSAKEKDTQIKIVERKTYGWLKVEGKSMNISTPIPIHDQDYVLFYNIDNLESCENKIVIATQPGLDEQYSLLIVKRLITMMPKSKRSNNAWKKYYLHSESSWDKYKDNIEFTEKNRLIGEVIAIAKPVK